MAGIFIKDHCKTNEGDNKRPKIKRERILTYEGQNTHHEQSEQT
jgi:hypothetical protein